MPPVPPQQQPQRPMQDVRPPQQSAPIQSAPKKKGGSGAIVGIVIIVALMIFAGLYFWGAYLNGDNTPDLLPLIPDDNTSTQ